MQNYRADIEGLRALAVILVILYHYQVPGITGGFVGVDVFFVISGFVITQLLGRKFSAGSFSFSEFYARRILRLAPVFLLVSSVTFVMISPFYLDEDYYVFAKSWLSSLVGFSNFYFLDELSHYFAPEALSISLLHTWSLAVEEQFYLLWPSALYLAYRFCRGRDGFWSYVLLGFLAFALSVYLAGQHPAAAYYLLPARLFEFMLGTGVALFASRLPALDRMVAEMLALLGVVLIIATAVLLHGTDHFPGYNALWPTLGTALLLYTGLHHTDTLMARLLSLRVMVFLGGISYSMYLWHWPPLALMHYQLIDLTWLNQTTLIAAVVLLSWLSHRFVENRYRYRPWTLRRAFLIFILLPALMIWAIQSTIRIADDISFRIPEERRMLYRVIAQNNAADLYKKCFKGDPYNFNKFEACQFGAPGPVNSVLIGDSHAIALIGFLEQLLQGTDLSLLLVTRASTPFLLGSQTDEAFAGDQERIDRNEALTEYLSQGPMTVFISAWWNSYLQNMAFQGYFIDAIEWLLKQQHQVVVLGDVPELPSASYAHCLLKSMQDCSIDAQAVRQRGENFSQLKQTVQERFPQVQWINPREAICDAQRCQTVLDGVPLYRDESHLNNVGSGEIGKLYLKMKGNPLLKAGREGGHGTAGNGCEHRETK